VANRAPTGNESLAGSSNTRSSFGFFSILLITSKQQSGVQAQQPVVEANPLQMLLKKIKPRLSAQTFPSPCRRQMAPTGREVSLSSSGAEPNRAFLVFAS
jgi:hypothetical protein